MESKTNLSPVVVGGTVTGFLVVMGLIIVALYLARRKSASSVRGGSGGSQDLSSQGNPTLNLIFTFHKSSEKYS